MPKNNGGGLGWSVNAGNNSGGMRGGIIGAALGAYGQANRMKSRLAEFDYKENAKRESLIHKAAVTNVSKRQQSEDQLDIAKKAYEHFGGDSEFNTGFRYGPLNITRETKAQRKRADTMSANAETAKEKEERLAKEKADAADTANGSKQSASNARRGRKKAAENAEQSGGWAATDPNASRTTSNVTPEPPQAPKAPKVSKPRKPRAPRAPKNPGQPGGMQ